MSRPFSYNDENFTVIGSLLIIHVAFTGKLYTNSVICEGPSGSAKRIKYTGFAGQYSKSTHSPEPVVKFYVSNTYLYISQEGNFKDGEFFAIVDLKDI